MGKRLGFHVVGVNTSFKGIKTFCLSSAIVMTSVFFTTMTLFLALLTLNMRSLEAHTKPLEKPRRHHHHHHKGEKDKEEELDNGLVTRFYRDVVSKVFMTTTSRVILLLLFAAYIGFSVYECTQITQGISPEDAVPEDSFVNSYLAVAKQEFQEKIAELNVVFYDTELSRTTRRVRSEAIE